VLTGGSRLDPTQHELPIAEIGAVRIGRRVQERLGGRTTLVLELADGRVFAIAGYSTLGPLHELAERLWSLTSPPPEQ
jgi:hypothetical protein